jgi:hypothetical protein
VSADAGHELLEHLSDGWSNPETYAAYVHLSADEGLREHALAAIAATSDGADRAMKNLMESYLDDLDDAGLVDEYRALCNDLGSRWRIDWAEIATAFRDDETMSA